MKGLQLYIEHNGDYRQQTNLAQIDPLTQMSQLQVIKHKLTHKKYPYKFPRYAKMRQVYECNTERLSNSMIHCLKDRAEDQIYLTNESTAYI